MSWQVTIPRAIQVVIDDVGWREGWRLDHKGGPYRAGVNRLLGPDDYQAIVELGRSLAIRPSAAMILCEWDPGSLCARQPTATRDGAGWDNRGRFGRWAEAAAGLIREGAAHFELALHGVGHEHWEGGQMTRAEWHAADGRRWHWEDLQAHLELFRDLLDHHALGPAGGHRFPRHFVPCAFKYFWDETDSRDTGALVAGAGVELVSTPFVSLDRRSPSLATDGGIDHGVLVLDRGQSGVPYDVFDRLPATVLGQVSDDGAGRLAALAAAALVLPPAETELLLARRPLGAAADRERLVRAKLGLLKAVVELNAGRGASVESLIAAGREAVGRAIAEFDSEQGLELDLWVEAAIRQAMAAALSSATGAPQAVVARGGSICGIHWPNLLSADPAANEVAVEHWRGYLREVGEQPGQMLAANVQECFAQWAWHRYGRVVPLADGFELDLTDVPPAVMAMVGELPVVVEVQGYVRLGRARPSLCRPVWYRRQGGRAFVALKVPGAVADRVTFDAEAGPLQPVVYREGTYNVFDLRPCEQGIELDLELFGAQRVTIATGFPPRAVELVAGRLVLESQANNPNLGVVALKLRGHDLQGERGLVRLLR